MIGGALNAVERDGSRHLKPNVPRFLLSGAAETGDNELLMLSIRFTNSYALHDNQHAQAELAEDDECMYKSPYPFLSN